MKPTCEGLHSPSIQLFFTYHEVGVYNERRARGRNTPVEAGYTLGNLNPNTQGLGWSRGGC